MGAEGRGGEASSTATRKWHARTGEFASDWQLGCTWKCRSAERRERTVVCAVLVVAEEPGEPEVGDLGGVVVAHQNVPARAATGE